MQTRGALTLAAAAAISVVVAGITVFSGRSPAADPHVGKPVLPQVAPKLADIAKVVLKHAASTITLVKEGNAWTVAEKSNYPADPQKMRKMLLALAQITYVEPKTAKAELYKRLELDDPGSAKSQSTEVQLYDAAGGAIGAVITGRRRVDELGGGNDGIYVRLPGDPQSWLARGNLDIDIDIVQWLDRRVIDIDDKRIKQAVLTGPDGVTLTINRDKVEDKFALKELPQGRKLKSDTTLVEPATLLQGFDLTDVAAAKDLSFPANGFATGAYTTFDGLTIHADVIKQGDKDWMRLSADSDGSEKAKSEAETLDKRWAGWVYGIPPYKAAAIRTKLADVLAPQTEGADKPGSGTTKPASPAPESK